MWEVCRAVCCRSHSHDGIWSCDAPVHVLICDLEPSVIRGCVGYCTHVALGLCHYAALAVCCLLATLVELLHIHTGVEVSEMGMLWFLTDSLDTLLCFAITHLVRLPRLVLAVVLLLCLLQLCQQHLILSVCPVALPTAGSAVLLGERCMLCC